jgi:hypothetical protein
MDGGKERNYVEGENVFKKVVENVLIEMQI